MEATVQYEIQPIHVLMLSILVLYLGMWLTRKVRFLRDNYIPPAVTGGLICSVVVAAIYGLEEADGKPFLVLELVEGEDCVFR